MEQITNIPAQSAIGGLPPLHSPSSGAIPARLPNTLLDKALHSGRDRRGGRAQRADGWTPPRIRAFLEVLARTGLVAAAARAAGMSRQSAYALRGSAKGQAFDDAWRRALLHAAPCIPDELVDRAINGWVEPVFRKGRLWGERHRFDNRLTLRVLRHLDKLATSQSPAARTLRAVTEDFDAFLEVISTGDEDQVDAFPRSRCAAHRRGTGIRGRGEAGRAVQSPNLSTLRRRERSESPDLSTLPGHAGAESPNLSSLPADQSAESCVAAGVPFLDGVRMTDEDRCDRYRPPPGSWPPPLRTLEKAA